MDSNIKIALVLLEAIDSTHRTGRFEVSPEIYYNVEEYETKDEELCRFESHKKYVDIQCILEGEEIIYVTPAEELKVEEDLLKERDVVFYERERKGKANLLKKGDYLILYPGDAHKAGVCTGDNRHVKKAVFKVLYQQ